MLTATLLLAAAEICLDCPSSERYCKPLLIPVPAECPPCAAAKPRPKPKPKPPAAARKPTPPATNQCKVTA